MSKVATSAACVTLVILVSLGVPERFDHAAKIVSLFSGGPSTGSMTSERTRSGGDAAKLHALGGTRFSHNPVPVPEVDSKKTPV